MGKLKRIRGQGNSGRLLDKSAKSNRRTSRVVEEL